MKEFDLIRDLFAPLSPAGAPAFSLRDDAAHFTPEAGQTLVISKDMMVEAIHFTGHEPPGQIARKLLRVNLSDLAAKGAEPVGYLLAMAVPASLEQAWLADFADGLRRDQTEFGCALWGGDSVATSGPMVFSLTLIGQCPEASPLLRSGAKAGDQIFVTGTIGDAALALEMQKAGDKADPSLLKRLRLPSPRIAFGASLPSRAHAAIDVSDGLVADAGHIARESGIRIELNAASIPLSPAASALVARDPDLLLPALTGGDDYELIVAVPEGQVAALTKFAEQAATPLTRIGKVLAGSGVHLLDAAGRPLALQRAGFEHF